MTTGFYPDPDNLLVTAFKAAQTAADGGEPAEVCQTAALSIQSACKAVGVTVHYSGQTQSLFEPEISSSAAKRQLQELAAAAHGCPPEFCFRSADSCRFAELSKSSPMLDGPVNYMACLPFEMGDLRKLVMRLYFTAEFCPSAELIQALGRNLQGIFDIAGLCMRQRRCLQAIDQAGARITSCQTEAEIVKATVDHVTAALGARGSIFWILDTAEQGVITCLSSGFAYQSLIQVDYPVLKRIFKLDTLEPVAIEDARYDERIPNLERLGKKRVVSLAGYPVSIGKTYLGLLAVYFGRSRRLQSHEQDFMASMAKQAAMALNNILYLEQDGEEALRQTVAGMAATIKAKDNLTHTHSLNVARLALWVARVMGLPTQQVQAIHHAALLHDIGKIGVTDKVLARLGCLDKSQMGQLRRHPEIGAHILDQLPYMEDLVPMVKHHHERYDGKGYPDGLQGEEICTGARILAVCDALETMLSGRPNIPACGLEQALAQLDAGAGSRFDPEVVARVIDQLKKKPSLVSDFRRSAMGTEAENSHGNSIGTGSWCTLPTSF